MPIIERLKTRFLIACIGTVADHGMISAAPSSTPTTSTTVLGVRERATTEIRGVIADPAPYIYVPLSIPQGGRPRQHRSPAQGSRAQRPRCRRQAVASPLHRCRNEAEAQQDKAEREVILAALEAALRRGDKSLVGNPRLSPLPQAHGRPQL